MLGTFLCLIPLVSTAEQRIFNIHHLWSCHLGMPRQQKKLNRQLNNNGRWDIYDQTLEEQLKDSEFYSYECYRSLIWPNPSSYRTNLRGIFPYLSDISIFFLEVEFVFPYTADWVQHLVPHVSPSLSVLQLERQQLMQQAEEAKLEAVAAVRNRYYFEGKGGKVTHQLNLKVINELFTKLPKETVPHHTSPSKQCHFRLWQIESKKLCREAQGISKMLLPLLDAIAPNCLNPNCNRVNREMFRREPEWTGSVSS